MEGFFKTLILTSVAFLVVYYFPDLNLIDNFFHNNSVSLPSNPEPSSSNSEPSFYGEENLPLEELELCNNPDVDETWTHGDALCYVVRRGLELSKIEIISWSDPLLVIYRGMFTPTQINGYARVFEKSKVQPEMRMEQLLIEALKKQQPVTVVDCSFFPVVASITSSFQHPVCMILSTSAT